MRLRRVDCSAPGIRRRRAGRGFSYADQNGAPVTDPDTLARIDALVIPPAWTDVWICPHPRGHIQATGVDAAGRRQYRYHDAWRLQRDRAKFDHMVAFGRALPRLRDRINDDLAGDGLSRTRVLACATRLLDLGFFRIGTEGYAEQNQTYGLATIRKEHVTVRGDVVTFDYVAKSGKQRIQSIVEPTVVEVVKALRRRRGGGPELLAYRNDAGGWCDVKSADINAYIKDVTGGDFSAKDFRTWAATVLGAVALAVSKEAATSRTARKRAVTRMYQEVSHYLGNTPAVCRASYVDPRVVDRYLSGVTVPLDKVAADAQDGHLGTQGAVEWAVLDLLEDAPPVDLPMAV
ncbi:MAG TPA: DNA topoisomerase IB [Frankiaceae bacterium]|jgi:DNA topoisomerase IB|nr:DNA topoisomerase IB [Frankiaceae bacterium]